MAPRSRAASQLTLCEPTAVQAVVRVEKNVIAIGLFSPTSKTTKGSKSKTVTFTREIDGKRIDASVTIVPGAIHGLPVTADQDKYLAFMHLVLEMRGKNGVVQNPIGFTSGEMLKLLGMADAGKNYQLIEVWLERMTGTLIKSKMGVYRAGTTRRWQTDLFHVFDRVVTAGKELPNGSIADRNYVWLSEWQLDNINSSYMLPIHFDRYRRLRNNIAKILAPQLKIWFYASRRDVAFEKSYDELCQMLNIKRYSTRSRIVEQLGPSLDELVEQAYLARWDVAPMRGEVRGYKLVFYDAERFRRHDDVPNELPAGEPASPDVQAAAPASGPNEDRLLEELTRRKITKKVARDLIASLAPDQPVFDQLEWADHQIALRNGEIRNKPGFYVTLIRDNVPVPEGFETERRRRSHDAWKQEQEVVAERQEACQAAYEAYWSDAVSSYIAANYTAEDLLELTERTRAEMQAADERYAKRHKTKAVTRSDDEIQKALRKDIAKRVPGLKPYEQFKAEWLSA